MDSAGSDPSAGAAAGRARSPFQPADMAREGGHSSRSDQPVPAEAVLRSCPADRARSSRAWSRAARVSRTGRARSPRSGADPAVRPGGKRSYALARISQDQPEKVAADVNSDGSGPGLADPGTGGRPS
jgi:hypothetical protein